MKTKFIFAAFLLAVTFNQFANAQTKSIEPRTVTDFYLQLPADMIDDTTGAAARRKRIAVEDLANNYVKLKPTEEQGADGYTEVALFKKSAGGYVVALVSVECTPNCIGTANYLERRADRWIDVKSRVYPTTRDGDLILYASKKTAAHQDYETTQSFWTVNRLPRNGRTVRTVYTSEGKAKEFEIFAATWNGERFVPDEPLPANVKAPIAPSDSILATAEKTWKSFFSELQAAVKRRDRKKLRLMMSENFSYNCCDEPYPDARTGAFTVWDGAQQKDYAGWKSLERELRTAQIYETSDDATPMRFLTSASFKFENNRWYFIAFGADEM